LKYKLIITVKKIRGKCPLYKPRDRIVIDEFYVSTKESKDICMHAFGAMLSLASIMVHGFSTKELGLSPKENVGYLQCPDPGPPCTKGGTVLFEIRRVKR